MFERKKYRPSLGIYLNGRRLWQALMMMNKKKTKEAFCD